MYAEQVTRRWPTLCWSTTDQCHRANMLWVFSCCRAANAARHRRKCEATSLVSSSQMHWRRSSCLRRLNATYTRHLLNDEDTKWLLCRTTARSNFRRETIAESRAAYQRWKVLRNVPGISNSIISHVKVGIGRQTHIGIGRLREGLSVNPGL